METKSHRWQQEKVADWFGHNFGDVSLALKSGRQWKVLKVFSWGTEGFCLCRSGVMMGRQVIYKIVTTP